MKTWNYGVNSLHKIGHVSLEEAKWYVFAIDNFTTWLCDYFPPIPFPAIGMMDEDGEKTTWKEYYGDTQQLFCVKVHMPIFQ